MASRRLKKKRLKQKQLSLIKVQEYTPKEERVVESTVAPLQQTKTEKVTHTNRIKRTRKRAIQKQKAIQSKSKIKNTTISQPTFKRENKKSDTLFKKKNKKLQNKLKRKAKLEKQKAETKARNKELAKVKRAISNDVKNIMSEQEQFERNKKQNEPTEDNTAELNSVELVGKRLDEFMERAMNEEKIVLREFKRDCFFRLQDTLFATAYSLADKDANLYDEYIKNVTEELDKQFTGLLYASSRYVIEICYASVMAIIYNTPTIPLQEAKDFEDFISEYQWNNQ